MKLNDNSVWLNAKSCKDGDIIVILNEGEWRDSTKFTYDDGNPVKQLVFKVKHEDEEKQLTLIKNSRIAMIAAFGDDTVEWVGKKAAIKLALNTQGGKSIILEPVVTSSKVEPKPQDNDPDLPF
jgi:hypothetical protein